MNELDRNRFEELHKKIDKDGETQSGPSTVDVKEAFYILQREIQRLKARIEDIADLIANDT